MALIQFKLKKRRREGDSSVNGIPVSVCDAFSSVEALQEEEEVNGAHPDRAKRRVELLEDTKAKIKRLQEEGNTLAEAGRFRVAMGRWQEALAVEPNNATLYELLAQACMAVYDDFQAVQFARKATLLAPTWSDGFLTLARCQLNFGELTLALEALDQATQLNGGVETQEIQTDRRDIQVLLAKQKQVLHQRDQEAAKEVEPDKLQVISCFKHLSLRAKAIEGKSTVQ
ncbi:Tetratricopeptide repeat protein 33 [Phytophthora boehmeriae]|uniref:Tetratricopeptide repeat protein 33 n=1 Tax=Phytophthora boehmeriae TaxID=109152 RepID=A0A8T1WYF3_9STRA|nr:Tetratricopeptide repeat protein 33 [Phytophthora boehmeriae]